jgi:beta-lactamase class A
MMFFVAMLLAAAEPSLAAIVEPAGGTVGFAAVELASGRTLGLNQNEPFPMQSVFKLPIAIEVLHQVDAAKIALDQEIQLVTDDAREGATGTIVVPSRTTVRKLLEAMVVSSDNVACDRLLALVGGPQAVDARMHSHGIEGITIRFSEREMTARKGDNTATPAAMVALLGAMERKWLGLLPASAKVLDDLLFQVATGAKRIKGALPPGTPVAHKSGTSRTQDGETDATNDVGLISLPNGNRIAIAVFVHDSPADEPTREETIAKLARAAYDTFLAPEVHTAVPAWLLGRWIRDSPNGHVELTLVRSVGVVRGDSVRVAPGGRPTRFESYIIERRGDALMLQLTLPKREGPTPFRLREGGLCLVPAEQRLCFHRSGSRPGPDVVEMFIDGARLHIRTGFGPQHGATVFEDLLLDKAPEVAPKIAPPHVTRDKQQI